MRLLHVFAENLRKYRASQGLTQEKLASISGLHVTYINAVERERRNISIENIERISDALEISPYLLFLTDDHIEDNAEEGNHA